ncbi:MAG TPA: type II toxin-antitoxin system prevent-host-death family antitoxin [Verrucomicrobiae bacterium]|nr:type II toxin-antitoxin system prevent-host-death family antitoxin [Verrucomicrobiae bacterium]
MTATLSKSQAELPRLVELASQGEDVVITVEGKPKARLTRADMSSGEKPAGKTKMDLAARAKQLAALRDRYNLGKSGPTADQILEDTRKDRLW